MHDEGRVFISGLTRNALSIITTAKAYIPRQRLWGEWELYDYVLDSGETVSEEIQFSSIHPVPVPISLFFIALRDSTGNWITQSLWDTDGHEPVKMTALPLQK